MTFVAEHERNCPANVGGECNCYQSRGLPEKYIDGAYYAECCHSLMQGDTAFIDELYENLKQDGFVDDDGEWIYGEGE